MHIKMEIKMSQKTWDHSHRRCCGRDMINNDVANGLELRANWVIGFEEVNVL